MGRSLLSRALMVLLLAALLAPVLEAFDRWDATPGLAGDTEFHVAALAVAAGLLAAVAIVAVRVSLPWARCACAPSAARGFCGVAMPPTFCSGSSPPSIPLRI
jgi:hypothetical protein